MNVAKLELCKELYEISGWGLHDLEYVWRLHLPSGADELQRTLSWEIDNERFRNHPEAKRFRAENQFFPAYELGYLLRKLPKHSAILILDAGYMAVSDPTDEALASDQLQNQFIADRPENAACKLAIELLKQGLLKKGQP